jgi:hypothetical protein
MSLELRSTASGALAATKQQTFQPSHNVYDARGTNVGSDPDANARFDLRRDSERGTEAGRGARRGRQIIR